LSAARKLQGELLMRKQTCVPEIHEKYGLYVLEEMIEAKNFTKVCSVQYPPPNWTAWSTFRIHTSKWTWSHPQPSFHAHISEDTKHSSTIR